MTYDPDAIFNALLSHAAATLTTVTAFPTRTQYAKLAVDLASPTTTPVGLGSDRNSEAIFSALLRAARNPVIPAATKSIEFSSHVLLATTVELPQGFMASKLAGLSSVVTIILGVLLIILGLTLAGCGARSLNFLNHWGKQRGEEEGRSYIPGGVGGFLFGGTAMGMLSSLLTLLIVSRQVNPTLGSWGTLAIIFSIAPVGCFIGGRFRFAARMFIGILAGVVTTLLITATFKLSTILPRLIILAILVITATVVSLIPAFSRSLTVMAASVGAYLLILGIDIFCHLGFIDALGLFVCVNGATSNGAGTQIVLLWGTSLYKGILAAWWIVFTGSAAWQYYWGGEGAGDAEDTWNSYLASFIASNPNKRGSFYPQKPCFARLFNPQRPNSAFTDIPGAFPRDRRSRHPWDEEKGSDWDSDADTIQATCSAPVKYGNIRATIEEADEDDEEEDRKSEKRRIVEVAVRFDKIRVGDDEKEREHLNGRREFDEESRLSEETMVEFRNVEEVKIETVKIEEDDVISNDGEGKRGGGKMRALFSGKTRHQPAQYLGASPSVTSEPASYLDATRDNPPATPVPSSPAPASLSPPTAVPVAATPSLLNALKRINVAQRQARGEESVPDVPAPVEPRTELIPVRQTTRRRGQSWDEFWGEVVDKTEKK